MKLKKINRRFDTALFRLQELHAMLQKPQTLERFATVAEEMEDPLNALVEFLEDLEDKTR